MLQQIDPSLAVDRDGFDFHFVGFGENATAIDHDPHGLFMDTPPDVGRFVIDHIPQVTIGRILTNALLVRGRAWVNGSKEAVTLVGTCKTTLHAIVKVTRPWSKYRSIRERGSDKCSTCGGASR